jgi:hypothetical protein
MIKEGDFVTALRQGLRPNGKPFGYPMKAMPQLEESEVRAIYAYLRTIPKLHNAVERGETASNPNDTGEGERLYSRYGCVGDHGAGGVGTPGVPNLKHVNEHFLADAESGPSRAQPTVAR